MTSTSPDGGRRHVVAERHEAAVDEQHAAVVEVERHDDVVAGASVLRAVDDVDCLVRAVRAGDDDRQPLDVVRIGAGGEHGVERLRRGVVVGLDDGVELLALIEPAQLPETRG